MMKLIDCILIFVFFCIFSVSLATNFTSFCRLQSTMIVASLDANLLFVESRTQPYNILHAVSLGGDLCFAQQRAKFVGSYIDCEETLELCWYNTEKGLVKRLGNAEQCMGNPSLLSDDTIQILSSKYSVLFGFDVENGILVEADKSSYKIKEGIWLTRTDYFFKGFDKVSQSYAWNVSVSEIKAECRCSENLHSCKKNVIVYRHKKRSGGYQSTPAFVTEVMRRYRYHESQTHNSSNYGILLFVFAVVVCLSLSAYLYFSNFHDKKEKQYSNLVSVDDENKEETLNNEKQPAETVERKDSDFVLVEDKNQRGTLNLDDNKQSEDSISNFDTVIGKVTVSPKLLGTGSNGTTVYMGTYDGRKVAVKRILCSSLDTTKKEIRVMEELDGHPNIVTYYHQECNKDFLFLCLELCLCNLHDLISHYSVIFRNSSSSISLPKEILDTKGFQLWKLDGFPTVELLLLLRDVISAIMYIHDHGYVHRDLKPQNVLIVKDQDLRAKISDMGISKQITGDGSSLDQHTGGIGTPGWQAPEVLNNGIQSSAMDIFGFGLVMYFCLTKGKHPFGEYANWEDNIKNDRKDLTSVEQIPEALHIIELMLQPQANIRPQAKEVSIHPVFWSSTVRLNFLADASDRLEKEGKTSQILVDLEARRTEIIGKKNNWSGQFNQAFLLDIRLKRPGQIPYKYRKVQGLLRVIRNTYRHHPNFEISTKNDLGEIPTKFDDFYRAKFPRLLIILYQILKNHCRHDNSLKKYFE